MTDQCATDHGRRFLRPLLLNRIALLLFGLLIGGVVLELSLRALFATRVGAEVLLFGAEVWNQLFQGAGAPTDSP